MPALLLHTSSSHDTALATVTFLILCPVLNIIPIRNEIHTFTESLSHLIVFVFVFIYFPKFHIQECIQWM